MARLVHLTRESSARRIQRAGLRGGKARVSLADAAWADVERAVYAMPVLPDFSTTYQWLRELRSWHGERMMAAHFRLASTEEVYVGRYNGPHALVPAAEAVRWVASNPRGAEIIVPRSIARGDVTGVRALTQLVGWTEVPEPSKQWDCLCQACIRPGMPDLMRRVRGTFERYVLQARQATSEAETLRALQGLHMPLERARGRIPPDKLRAFARSKADEVRHAATTLFGLFRWPQVKEPLEQLFRDPSPRVRVAAIHSLVASAGIERAWGVVSEGDPDMTVHFLDCLAYRGDTAKSAKLLAKMAAASDLGRDRYIRSQAIRTCGELLRDDDLGPDLRRKLEDLAASLGLFTLAR